MLKFKVIKTTKDLDELCNKSRTHKMLSLDSEFMRGRYYYPKLCLLQFKVGEELFILDILENKLKLTNLLEVLVDKNIIKVIHAASQDVEAIFHTFNINMHPIFDTQLALMFCGYLKNFSYQATVLDICHAPIDKKLQRSNWERRPLEKDLLEYAVTDVLYLDKIYTTLKNKLKKMHRTTWFNEETKILYNKQSKKKNIFDSWKKIPHINKITNQDTLSFLCFACAWREQKAQNRDVPKNFIVHNDLIVEMVNLHFKGQIGQNNIYYNYIADIEIFIEKNKRQSCLQVENKNVVDKTMLNIVQKYLITVSKEQNILSLLISNQDNLKKFCIEPKNNHIYTGWRKKIFGKTAYNILTGKTSFFIKDGQVLTE